MTNEHKLFYFGCISCLIGRENITFGRIMSGWYKDRKQAEKWLKIRMDGSVFYNLDEKYLFTKFSENKFSMTDMFNEWKGIK